jgi:hypothetical protein
MVVVPVRLANTATSTRPVTGYHIKPAAALVKVEFPELVGAALSPVYRGGRWFESTAAHH